ncbi:hypothetical protein CspHIS471_0407590 [Cutaneotrichosporon sp. HIS471]|nr:hypothetical protein CspHIS471_0407590 [Cutaneotrichosporon sp. HIS471]
MAQTITTTFSSKAWDMRPQHLGIAFEHDHAITEIHFKGDMEGVGTGSYVVTYLHGKSSKKEHFSYSGQILFEGTICGKKGNIIINEGGWSRGDKFHASWIFDTASASGDLQGLAGEGAYDSTPGPTKTDQVVKLDVSFP